MKIVETPLFKQAGIIPVPPKMLAAIEHHLRKQLAAQTTGWAITRVKKRIENVKERLLQYGTVGYVGIVPPTSIVKGVMK